MIRNKLSGKLPDTAIANKLAIAMWCLTGLFCVVSCIKYDDYMKYVEGGEIIYPQKADSVKTFSGRNRVQLEWQTLDPRVVNFKVLYGYAAELDSIDVPVSHTETFTVDTIRTIISGLDETGYSFRIISYDAAGNKSLTVEADETAYGTQYESRLFNRAIKTKQVGENEVIIGWYDGDPNEIGIDLTYYSIDGSVKTVFTPGDEVTTAITDFSFSHPISYKTRYKPNATAIDEFTASDTEEVITFPTQLTNNHTPFAVTDEGMWQWGRFGTLANWKMNDMASPESVDNDGGATWITFVTGWGLNDNKAITNGKIWQTLSLEPGKYKLSATMAKMEANGHLFLVASKGFHIPDTEDIGSSLGYCELSTDPRPAKNDVLSCTFKLDEPSLVSVGMVANVTSETSAGVYAIDLEKTE
jgi:hypothetical protein